MTGISMEFEFDDREAQAMLRDMLMRLDDRRTFFANAGAVMMERAKASFRNEQTPDGTAWTPLRAATIRARTRKGQLPITILRANTKGVSGSSLAGSITIQTDNDEARIGTPKEYGAIHQLGGTIDKPARQAKIYRMKDAKGNVGRRFASKKDANHVTDVTIPAHTITIPARPFLGLSKADRDAIVEDAEDWLIRR